MAVAGSLTYDTKIDKSGFKKGLNGLEKETGSAGTKIKDIVAGLGITKIIGKAFSLISDNMDSAIKRIDTLNNFPKVMSNLGISSEDSTKAINKLSDGLKGIPTKLDDASLAVQRFTSINNDVNKSTDYFLAFNNALLAGGASADIQSNALEQLSQMYAVGTVDAQAWRSVQTAMPAQLQQVAQSMGYTSTAVGGDFYNAIQKGKISMEDFMQQIVKLNKEGTGQYASFAEQAKSATGGIQTAISNAKTAISRGVAQLISKVNEGLQNAGIGSISDIISEKGKNIEKVLKAVAEQIPKVIDLVIKNKDALLDLAKVAITTGAIFEGWKVASAIQKVVTGFQEAKLALTLYSMQINGANIANGVFNGTLTVGETIVGLLTGKIKLAELATAAWSKAQTLLNAILKANPIALVVTAIGLLVAGFIYLWNTSEGFRNFWIGLWEKIKQETSVAVENITKFFTKTIPEAFNRMIEWFKNIPQKVSNFGESISNKIKEKFNGIRDKIKTSIKEIGDDISNKLKDGWNSIVNFFTQTIPQWLQELQQWFQDLPYKAGYLLGQILGNIVKFGINALNWVATDLPKIINAIIDWFAQLPGRIWKWLLQTISNIQNWGQQVWDNVTTAMSNMIDVAVEWISQLPGKIWEWLVQTAIKIEEWKEQIVEKAKNAFREFVDKATTTIKELPGRIWEWLLNTIDKVKQWGKDMARRGRETAQDLFDSIVNKVKEIPGEMLKIGRNIVEGIWNGIKNTGNWIKGKISEFANGVVAGFKDSLGIHSPSVRIRDEVGKYIPEGFAVGIEANTDSALKAINNMNDEIVAEMNRAVAVETGSINAKASVKSNNSMLNIIKASFEINGNVDIDGKRAGRYTAPYVMQTIKAGGI